jgi:D-xylose transport system substrate-binding protein
VRPVRGIMERLDKNDPVKIENWNLIGRLGSGGMGDVFVASDGVQNVALKVFHRHLMRDHESKSRLQREIDTIEKVESKNVVKLISQNLDNDPAWIALEFINGPDLKTYVDKNGPLIEKDWLILANGLLQGLSDIHHVNVIHRDIKPSNIILTESGPKIIDFGIAQSIESTSLTKTGLVAGSPGWLSPEQIHGGSLTPATDVFSAGSVLYFAASGNTPWGNESTNTTPIVLNKILNKDPELIDLTILQKNLIQKMLNKEVGSRISLIDCLLIITEGSIQLGVGGKGIQSDLKKSSFELKNKSIDKNLSRILIFVLSAGLITLTINYLSPSGMSSDNIKSLDSSASEDTAAGAASGLACVILPNSFSPRWENGDRPALKEALEAAGFTTDIQNAEGDAAKVLTIGDQMLASGCNVMLITDYQGVGAQVAAKAKAQGVPTIAYDSPIEGVDYYVSFDFVRVGTLQGEGILKCLTGAGKDPKTAELIFLDGDPLDGSSAMFAQGYDTALKAAGVEVDKEVLGVKRPDGTWDGIQAGRNFEQALTANGGKVDAVVSANDYNAREAIKILDKYKLTVPVSGQDSTRDGISNVLSGKQCMTVFKDYLVEAATAADLAIAILKGETPTTNKQFADGTSFQEVDLQALYADSASLDGFKQALDRIGATAADVCVGDTAVAKCKEIGLS